MRNWRKRVAIYVKNIAMFYPPNEAPTNLLDDVPAIIVQHCRRQRLRTTLRSTALLLLLPLLPLLVMMKLIVAFDFARPLHRVDAAGVGTAAFHDVALVQSLCDVFQWRCCDVITRFLALNVASSRADAVPDADDASAQPCEGDVDDDDEALPTMATSPLLFPSPLYPLSDRSMMLLLMLMLGQSPYRTTAQWL